MKIYRHKSIFAMGVLILSTGCIDNKYDLTDIDTTTRINVNELVVPINIDNIELKSIIDLKEEGKNGEIKVVDGEYAYVKWGDFTTGDISVPEVTINTTKSSSVDINLPVDIPAVNITLPTPINLPIEIPTQQTGYNFKAENISEDICGLSKVTAECDIRLDVEIEGIEGADATYEFNDFSLLLPEGMALSMGDDARYDENAHTIIINNKYSTPKFSITGRATSLTLSNNQFDGATHSLNMEGNVGVIGGRLNLSIKGGNIKETKNLSLKVNYSFSTMHVTAVDGIIRHKLDNVDIPEIDITNLPDVLNQTSTCLILTNPQIYLSVNNPLSICDAYAQTGLEITSYLKDAANTYAIDEPYFTIAANPVDNFCFSPTMPKKPDSQFANCVHVGFKELSNVLWGDHIPDKLKVDLVNPQIPEQPINGFMLGHNYGNIHGEYKFVAPLQFDKGTTIRYSDKLDGWSSDDLDKLTVTDVKVKFKVTTDIPMTINLSGYLLDKNGHAFQDVNMLEVEIPANAKDHEVTITATGEIKNLDGIQFVAHANGANGGPALSPEMKIELKEIRPCVTGYYQTEL